MSAAGVPPIVFENRDLVVIDKPSGLLSVPGRGEDKQDCALTRIQTIIPSALVVHRLDMATSGLLVFAKGARMQRALSQAFQNRETTKYYRAAVIGQPALTSNDWQTIEAPLIVDWPNRPKSKVCFETGKVSMKVIDDAVKRILRVKFELGLFDDPYKYCDSKREKELIYHPDHLAAALDIAKKSIVLLKNKQQFVMNMLVQLKNCQRFDYNVHKIN